MNSQGLGSGISERPVQLHTQPHCSQCGTPHPECPSQVNLSTTYGQIDTSEGRSLPKREEFQQAHAVVWMTIEKMPNKSGEMWILVQGTQRG